ncbi:hypothetical protein QM012_005594 [Aureobasidium pullulans]|uniref:Cytochrome P450 n=1 Tax=Aureobasidium pullulans TaxID=5580 RepID=A0ABR0T534_AURPU
MESILKLEPAIEYLMRQWLHQLDQFAEQSTTFDLGYWLQLFAFDAVGAFSFSRPFGFVEQGDDQGMFAKIENASGSAMWVMHAKWVYQLHQRIVKPLLGNLLALNHRNGFFFNFAQDQVRDRKENGGSNEDIVGQLFRIQETKPEVSDLTISFMMTSNVFAGADTTSTAMRAVVVMLLKHERVRNRFLAELRERQVSGSISDPVKMHQTEDWPYFQAILYESLRIHPPAAFNLDRTVPQSGCTIQGRFVPGGTVVGTNAWVLHRSVAIWGEDAEAFRPERWLEPGHSAELKRYFFAFGGGTRTCIGRHISWLEISKVITTLFMRYRITLADDAQITDTFRGVVFIEGLRVKISLRE